MATSDQGGSSDPALDLLLGLKSPPREAVFPVLRASEQGTEANAEVAQRFLRELSVKLIVNVGSLNAMRMLRVDELAKLGLTPDECFNLATTNIIDLWRRDGYALQFDSNGVGQLELPDVELSSGLLCAKEVVEYFLEICAGRIYASVPRRHVVLLAHGTDESATALRARTEAMFAGGDGRPVSSRIFTCAGVRTRRFRHGFRSRYELVSGDAWTLVQFE